MALGKKKTSSLSAETKWYLQVPSQPQLGCLQWHSRPNGRISFGFGYETYELVRRGGKGSAALCGERCSWDLFIDFVCLRVRFFREQVQQVLHVLRAFQLGFLRKQGKRSPTPCITALIDDSGLRSCNPGRFEALSQFCRSRGCLLFAGD